ncbi:MAG: LPS translocon maturation chaperone LptM [Magnetospiraceae bacterium]
MIRDTGKTVTRRVLFRLVLMSAGAGVLAACGRKGSLERPPDSDPNYPRQYPAPDANDRPPAPKEETR